MRRVAILLSMIGLGFRLAPLADHGGRLLQQFPTEDGYLMLAIARNVALGHGMSTAAGTLPTNGTQPLVTYLWAIGYWLTGADKTLGVMFALIAETLFSIGTAWLVLRLGQRVLAARPWGTSASWLAASAWFASPLVMPHTMNCLESGAYAFMTVWVASLFAQDDTAAAKPYSWMRSVGVGVVLGVAFWVRNDAAFLILAACITYLLGVNGVQLQWSKSRLASVLTFGAVSVLVASPWMISNYVGFGHIMPISGRAESLDAHFGGNLKQVPGVLVEYLTLILPLPASFQNSALGLLLCTALVLAAMVGGVMLWRRANEMERRPLLLLAIFLGALSLFYGTLFGAGYFMSRYLFPASPLLALVWSAVIVHVTQWVSARVRVGGGLVMAGLVVLIVGLNLRVYAIGDHHQHFQVVRWVERHVPDDVWIAAVQTGTVGYFHDRTINLDGKVNPDALQARLEGRLNEYMVERRPEYLADWVGMAHWGASSPVVRATYETLIEDRALNLGVMRRKH